MRKPGLNFSIHRVVATALVYGLSLTVRLTSATGEETEMQASGTFAGANPEADVNWLLAGRETTNAGCGQAELSESSYGVAQAHKAFPMQLGDLALRVAFADLAQGIEFVWS
jgi:hypothetical protein